MGAYQELRRGKGSPIKGVCVCVCVSVSHSIMSDSVTPWMVACQAPLSMGFSRQEYWSGLPFPFPGHLPNPGIDRGLPHYRQIL